MITFWKDKKLHCEPCPACKQCQGTKYLCESGLLYNYTEKPICSDPPKGYFSKFNTFEKCHKPCNGTNEYEYHNCTCRNRKCKCLKGFYRDVHKECTKRCSKCSTNQIQVKEECDSVPDPDMVIYYFYL